MDTNIFKLIDLFVTDHPGIMPTEFSIQVNNKIDEKFLRVTTPRLVYVWYFERDPIDEDIIKIKKYWCPTHQVYTVGNSAEIIDSIHEMMNLGQTRTEIALHLGINSTKVNRIYREIITGVLIEKESPYVEDVIEGGFAI